MGDRAYLRRRDVRLYFRCVVRHHNQRRRMIVAWANYLDEAERGAKVIALRAGGADA